MVIKYFNLPAEHQATYIALWKGNKESVKQNLTTIKKAADFIITELEKIMKDKSQKKDEPPVAESSFQSFFTCRHRKLALKDDGSYECESCGEVVIPPSPHSK